MSRTNDSPNDKMPAGEPVNENGELPAEDVENQATTEAVDGAKFDRDAAEGEDRGG